MEQILTQTDFPNSASGAGWTLPSDADITELAFEALAPVDPITSFAPVSIPLYNAVQHPNDGQLYLQGSTSILVLDANNDPAVIDLYDFDDLNSEIVGIAIGPSGNIHVAFENGMFKLISQSDGTVSDGLPDAGFEIGLFEVLPSGIYVMTSDGTLLQLDASNTWSRSFQPPRTVGLHRRKSTISTSRAESCMQQPIMVLAATI